MFTFKEDLCAGFPCIASGRFLYLYCEFLVSSITLLIIVRAPFPMFVNALEKVCLLCNFGFLSGQCWLSGKIFVLGFDALLVGFNYIFLASSNTLLTVCWEDFLGYIFGPLLI